MKRYLVFVGQRYYPAGGWGDFKGAYTDKQTAHKIVKQELKNTKNNWDNPGNSDDDCDDDYPDWGHVVDLKTGDIIKEYTL